MTKPQKVIAPDFYKNPIEVDVSKLQWRPAAYGIVIKDNKILLSKQVNGYDLPGGGINLGENPEQAVIREIKEETGINAKNPKLVDAGTAFYKSWTKGEVYYQAIALYYVCEYQSGKLSASGLEDYEKEFTEGPVWLSLDELESIKMGSYREFRKAVMKALNK